MKGVLRGAFLLALWRGAVRLIDINVNGADMATLYFSRNPNPRLAVAVARHLGSDLRFEFAASFAPENRAKFTALNPSRLLPILEQDGQGLWEADAIACQLSWQAGSQFWRMGAALPEMIRWLSWGKANFVQACEMVHFERGTKQRYGMGPIEAGVVAEGLRQFAQAAAQLEAHLQGRDFLLDDGLSYADFRMGTFLPFNDVAGLPLGDYPRVAGWAARLAALPAWSDPFAGLQAPALPPIASST
jgi:glutathione S-transferase